MPSSNSNFRQSWCVVINSPTNNFIVLLQYSLIIKTSPLLRPLYINTSPLLRPLYIKTSPILRPLYIKTSPLLRPLYIKTSPLLRPLYIKTSPLLRPLDIKTTSVLRFKIATVHVIQTTFSRSQNDLICVTSLYTC